MADTVDQETRSRIMASVGQRNTGPEVRLRRVLHRLGMRYRLHDKRLPGSPDLVFPKFRAVVFVHGCFWHSHGCKYSTVPLTRRDFWSEKFHANRERDARKIKQLHETGWRVLVVWECSLRGKQSSFPERRVAELVVIWINGDQSFDEITALDC